MRVVFGGAFNPPTKAHLEVYRFLQERLPLERFIFLPVSKRYKKADLAPDHHRLAMLALMVEGLPDAEVSDLEVNDETFKGTYASLKRLAARDHETAFVLGADHLGTLPRWKNAEKLLREFRIIVLNREGKDLRGIVEKDPFLSAHEESFLLFPDFDHPVSASTFRKCRDASLLDPKVHAYIEENGLYGASYQKVKV